MLFREPDKRHQGQKTPDDFCQGEQKTLHLLATLDRRHQIILPPWTEDFKLFYHPGQKTPFFSQLDKRHYCLASLEKRSNFSKFLNCLGVQTIYYQRLFGLIWIDFLNQIRAFISNCYMCKYTYFVSVIKSNI